MMDSMKQVCDKAVHEADIARVEIANVCSILKFQERRLEGESRRTAVAQREVLDDAEEALSRAIYFINQAKTIGV